MFKVRLVCQGMTRDEMVKAEAARAWSEQTMNHPKFHEQIRNFSYNDQEYVSGRLWWKKYRYVKKNCFAYTDLTNEQVLDTLLTGAEVLDPEKDCEADIYLMIDRRSRRNVIGYTNPSTKIQYIYENWFYSMSAKGLADNFMHEWAHKLDFDHPYDYTYAREFSVPYALGYMVERFQP